MNLSRCPPNRQQANLLDRPEDVNKRRRKDLALAKAELTAFFKALTNLLMVIESGAMRPDEALFIGRMAHHKSRMAALEADVQSLERQLSTSKMAITTKMIAAFADKMAAAIHDGDPAFRKAYVRLFVSRVELTAEGIRIFGTTEALERALIHDAASDQGEVPIFDWEWCRTRCATASPRTCSRTASICASSRSCWGTPSCRPLRSIPGGQHAR